MAEKTRMNLKELRDNLNQIKDEKYLEDTAIALDFATSESPSQEFGLMTHFGNNFEDEGDLYARKESKIENEIVDRLVAFLNKDLKQAKIRPEEEGYDEDYNMEGDWD